jgi:hypothetical protein
MDIKEDLQKAGVEIFDDVGIMTLLCYNSMIQEAGAAADAGEDETPIWCKFSNPFRFDLECLLCVGSGARTLTSV